MKALQHVDVVRFAVDHNAGSVFFLYKRALLRCAARHVEDVSRPREGLAQLDIDRMIDVLPAQKGQ